MSKIGRDVVISGVGPVTAIGVGQGDLWAALQNGTVGAAMRPLPVDVGRVIEVPVASMPPCADVPGLAPHLDYLSSQECDRHRDLAYSLLATELALADARLDYNRSNNNVGVIQAFEAPGVESTVVKLFELLRLAVGEPGASMPPPAFSRGSGGPPPVYDLLAPNFYNMQPFVYVHLAAKAFGFRGFCTSVHNACSSGAFALQVAADQIRRGAVDAMIVAGGEAFDTGVRLEWFHRLGLYAKSPRMQPFAQDAAGFFVGEGGAAIVLESAERAASRGAGVYARLTGAGFAHQGWKQTIPDLPSARLADVIKDALRTSGRTAADVDLIAPHGAGTNLSDSYEAQCTEAALGTKLKSAVATFKPFVGHMLACSGITDTICGLLALRNGRVPGTPHIGGATAFPASLPTQTLSRSVKTMLKLFTGFTGHDAAMVFEGES